MNARSGIEACMVSLISAELEEGGELREKIWHFVQMSLESDASGGMMEAVSEEVRTRVERVNIERIVRMVAKDLDFKAMIRSILAEQEVAFASTTNETRLSSLEERVRKLDASHDFSFDALAAVLGSLDDRVSREIAQLWEAIREIKGSGVDMPLPVEPVPPPAAGLKRYKVSIREVHDSVRFVDAEDEERAGQIAQGTEEHHLRYVRTLDTAPRVIAWGGPELDPQFPPVVQVGKK
jgi:hypothetical protein